MQHLSREQIEEAVNFKELISSLKVAFQGRYEVPMRHHHDFPNPVEGRESTLLLMPAWEAGEHVGVKIVTVSPNNGKYDLPSIQGLYLLMDAHKGRPLVLFDAKSLTAKRTAAASALASSFLSRKNSRTLLMVGTGALAPELIQAHSAVRPIEKVLVWGRNLDKAQELANLFENKGYEAQIAEDIQEAVSVADIISCATLSPKPLIKGSWLKAGQHLDLVGAYRPDMRESDDEAVRRASLFVDTFQGGTKEGGDIFIPLEKGVIQREDIKADLFSLSQGKAKGRQGEEEITLFKSVGHALEDLAAAQLVWKKLNLLTS
ncbi:ornithine cyclodeaminase family protein [Xanthovirga aplysinae]|uniref:ornithine cyclodeaminase family protein n=1 Tax=Xanthovirga aplysinae TaxID=2529853 RepID=UPI0012BD3C32|nr:ornithine cyclodeaminase family protein [Xanthovirga aplysinae]MTI30087.1 ornithine cyclodeaminase family protein [Xanthovirga aplysinae]